MNVKKKLIALGAAALLCLSGCASKPTQINVKQADMLTIAASSADKFAGVVVSENAVEITRDTTKNIEKLHVSVGDSVRVNEKLFEYDTDALSLTIDKQELEMDKLEQQIKDLKTQVTNLEKQIKNEKDKTVKATLELSLRSVNADLTQANYDKQSLQAEITYNKNMLTNAVVRSPIKGTVRSIDENGSPYITIQQAGAYQVKGILNELSLNAGIMEGANVTILSRTDENLFWTGVVSLVDYNTTSSNEYDSMFGGGDSMSTSTNYPFYITLDSTDGLLLGQHVYIQLAAPASDEGLYIPERYIMDITTDEGSLETTGTVWGVDMENQTLTKLTVTLGYYDHAYGTYQVLSGITGDSYLADPADPGCREGAAVRLRSEMEYMGQTEPAVDAEDIGGGEEFVPNPDSQKGDAIEDPVSNGRSGE
jgi:HlyD family secretion protein